jgi:hypothetical protein
VKKIIKGREGEGGRRRKREGGGEQQKKEQKKEKDVIKGREGD